MLTIIPAQPLPYHQLPSSFSSKRGPADSMDIDDDSSSISSSSSYDADLGIGSSTKTTITTPGEAITTAKEFMRGHGTYLASLGAGGAGDGYDEVMDGNGGEGEEMWVMGSVAGVVERVNKLVTVRSMKGRYIPEVGDLLIGRITDVRQSTWKVDCNSRLEGQLGLGSVNLPGGVLRRKLESDVLRMRELLKEGDLLVAEVQGLKGDGGMELHTRSLRYGKLRNGTLLTLSPHLIRRLKSHFITLPPFPSSSSANPSFNPNTTTSKRTSNKSSSKPNPNTDDNNHKGKAVDIILGVNGYVWVMESTGKGEDERRVMGFQGGGGGGGDGGGDDGEGRMYSDENDIISPSSRQAISQTCTLILLFAKYSIPLTDQLLMEGQRWMIGCGGTGVRGGNGAGMGLEGMGLEGMGEEVERRIVSGVCGVRVGEVDVV